MLFILIFIIIGFVASFLSGMFGISGGIILMPALLVTLAHSRFNPSISHVHLAINTSLAIIAFNSIFNVHEQYKEKRISWKLLYVILPGAIVGACIGSGLSNFFDADHTVSIAGGLLLLLGLMMLCRTHDPSQGATVLNKFKLILSGVCVGLPASFLGIGGSSIMVPVFNLLGIDIKMIIGLSSVFALITSLATLISIAIITFYQTKAITNVYMIVDWYVVLYIAPMMFIGVRLGSKCLNKLPRHVTQFLFIAMLMTIGFAMIVI